MKIVVLITSTLALILAYWKYKQSGKEICNENGHHDNGVCISDSTMLWNSAPCQTNTNKTAYNNFRRKHILQSVFDFNSMVKWTKYLKRKRICSRNRGTQSFIEISNPGPVVQICNGDGRQLYINTNYCISDSTMLVHVLRVQPDCTVTGHSQFTTKVVVSCDEINNQCLPVHFKESTNQSPAPNAIVCKP